MKRKICKHNSSQQQQQQKINAHEIQILFFQCGKIEAASYDSGSSQYDRHGYIILKGF